MNNTPGWYNLAKSSELTTEAGWKDVGKGLMWGGIAGLVPAAVGLMHQPTQQTVARQPTNIVQQENSQPSTPKPSISKPPTPSTQPTQPTQPAMNKVAPDTNSAMNKAAPEKPNDLDKILNVIHQMESSGGTNSVPRFEPAFLERYKNAPLMKKLISTYGARDAASSFGPYQIMLLKAHEMGFNYSPQELSDPVKNKEVAQKIVSGLVSKGLAVKDVFKRYNGGGKMADRYSQKAMKLYNTSK